MVSQTLQFFKSSDFNRDDENTDEQFYAKPRLVTHLDSLALNTVEEIYFRLIPKYSNILDLMAGPDSHIKDDVAPLSITGLGLNQKELEANHKLDKRVIHDLNLDWRLPFENNWFDAVINTVSVDYLTRPIDVFSEVHRVLKPRGIFVIVFSNRMFPTKAVNIWKRTPEKDKIDLVKKFMSLSGKFQIQGYSESKGRPRPKDDKYSKYGIPSDPIYAVWSSPVK
ncbi:MAG: class I SAM-dependent methyltransferase [Desulfomonilaceae bacterium]